MAIDVFLGHKGLEIIKLNGGLKLISEDNDDKNTVLEHVQILIQICLISP